MYTCVSEDMHLSEEWITVNSACEMRWDEIMCQWCIDVRRGHKWLKTCLRIGKKVCLLCYLLSDWYFEWEQRTHMTMICIPGCTIQARQTNILSGIDQPRTSSFCICNTIRYTTFHEHRHRPHKSLSLYSNNSQKSEKKCWWPSVRDWV